MSEYRSAAAAATRAVLDDFEAEQRDLEALLRDLAGTEWSRPTPAVGWDVRDQVSHLADTEDVAYDTVTGGPRTFNDDVRRYATGEAFTESGCDRGRAMKPGDVLAWWSDSSARVRAALADADRSARVPWGLGMGWKAFVTARLMEHWAHGLDIRAAVGRPGVDTDRLRHVAWIGYNALPYAFQLAAVEAPSGRILRLELTGPDVALGPGDATDVVRGPTGQWCRLAVRRATRAECPDLTADGPLADLALAHARAFL